jgi:hypothetical protein
MRAGYLGQIVTPAAGNRLEPWVEWIADNAIYSNAYPGDAAYLTWLRSHADYRSRCRFAVAPDVVADHQATLERSWPMLAPIRRAVGRVALCAQNGATPEDLPWGYFDAVFLAGIVECVTCGYIPRVETLPQSACPSGHPLTEWKVGATAAAIAAEAKRRGAWCHMGRVNTDLRIRRAREMGCDSGDGTYLAWGPDQNLPKLLSRLYPGNFRFIRPEASARPLAVSCPDTLFDDESSAA